MREPGFYWVKCESVPIKWVVAWWGEVIGIGFTWIYDMINYNDSDWDEIDECRIVREEHPGYIETSLGNWVKVHEDTYDKLLSEITQAINNGDDFMEKLLEDDELQKLVSKAILAKAVQLAK